MALRAIPWKVIPERGGLGVYLMWGGSGTWRSDRFQCHVSNVQGDSKKSRALRQALVADDVRLTPRGLMYRNTEVRRRLTGY